jgi:hypothetical protein
MAAWATFWSVVLAVVVFLMNDGRRYLEEKWHKRHF